ncbi:MAG: hypothetical protein NWR73_05345 [Flavobacteriales bacterium]|nr:hypothetical protein [Flavobacteriales bacterium]
MRKVKFFFAFLLAAGMLNASAQNSQEPIQTLLGDSPSLGGFIGFGGKMTTFNKQGGLMLGGELNMVLGRGMNLGFHGYGLVTETTSSNFDEFGKSLYYNIGYGGLTLEPVFFSEKAVHFTVPILLGGGGIGESRYPLVDGDNSDYEDFPGFYRTDFFFYAEPGLNVELNLVNYVRIYAGASYRFVYDVDLPNLNDANMSGLGVNMGLRVGIF